MILKSRKLNFMVYKVMRLSGQKIIYQEFEN